MRAMIRCQLTPVLFGLAIASVTPASAQIAASPPAGAAQGAATGLGVSHRFASADLAAAHCPDDVVVWAPGQALTYLTPGAAGYAKGGGFYACKMEADDAGLSRLAETV